MMILICRKKQISSVYTRPHVVKPFHQVFLQRIHVFEMNFDLVSVTTFIELNHQEDSDALILKSLKKFNVVAAPRSETLETFPLNRGLIFLFLLAAAEGPRCHTGSGRIHQEGGNGLYHVVKKQRQRLSADIRIKHDAVDMFYRPGNKAQQQQRRLMFKRSIKALIQRRHVEK
ncbi:uncharacterized protein V6R79_006631 [Siganus canaliculatus]